MSQLRPVSVVDFGSYLPGEPIGVDAFLTSEEQQHPLADSPMFRLPRMRHHVKPGERAAEMIERAARPMFDRLGVDPADGVDLLMTNVLLPDGLFMGCGAEAAHLLGSRPKMVLDLHNAGCGSFMYMMQLARTLIGTGEVRNALLCNVQNATGQVFTQSRVRTLKHSAMAGDGCGVAYLAAGDSAPILGVEVRNEPEFATDLDVASPDGRRYWEPGEGQIDVRFDETKTAEIMQRGNRLVPEVVEALCARIGVLPRDIDTLVTNQPSRIFLQVWREALGPRRHADTFDDYGNLYGAAVPVTLDRLARAGDLPKGDLVVMAGFAHAGDFASAAAFRCG